MDLSAAKMTEFSDRVVSIGSEKIHVLHKMIGSDEMAEIPLELESAGTLKMFAWQLSDQLLRRDEIWFVEKDEEGVIIMRELFMRKCEKR